MSHLDFNQAGAHAYEQAMLVIRQLDMPEETAEEQFRRMTFNIVARNQDDHVKNIAFLMDKQCRWSLSPAFDVTYSHNPAGEWTASHQMTVNSKRDNFSKADFKACEKSSMLKRGRSALILDQVTEAVKRWPEFAIQAGVSDAWTSQIQKSHRLVFPDA
jgi:serine/threonine-protein kinase HipA